MLTNAVDQSLNMLTDPTPSRASSLPQVYSSAGNFGQSGLFCLQGFHAFTGAQKQQIRRARGEQAVGDHADDGVDLRFQLHRVGDLQVEHVEDDVAVVGQHAFAVHRVAAEFHQLARHVAAGHRDHFHRQRKLAEHRHQFAGVGDADEGLGHGGDNLLAGQGRTAALDQVQVRVGFISAVNVELQVADRVQLVHRNAVALEARGGGFGAGDRAIERALVQGQGVDEAVGGGAGADADDALVVEFRQDEVDGGLGHGLFELILGHAGSESGQGLGRKAGIIAASAAKTSGFVWSHRQKPG